MWKYRLSSDETSKESKKKEDSDAEDDIWKGPAKILDEKSREDEFEDYLADLLLWSNYVYFLNFQVDLSSFLFCFSAADYIFGLLVLISAVRGTENYLKNWRIANAMKEAVS